MSPPGSEVQMCDHRTGKDTDEKAECLSLSLSK